MIQEIIDSNINIDYNKIVQLYAQNPHETGGNNMKLKKIITGLLSVCLTGMSIPAITVNADNSTYISDIKVVGGDSETDAKKILADEGYTIIDYDLNKTCSSSSDKIFLGYKTSTNIKDAIKDIVVIDSDSKISDEQKEVNGITYDLCPFAGGSHFCGLNGDVNSNTGGDYIYIYYTKNNSLNSGITGISFDFDPANAVSGVDLNNGISNSSGELKPIYMHLSYTQNQTPVPNQGNTASGKSELGFEVKISVDKTVIHYGSEVTIYTEIKGEVPDDAWIAFVPSDIPHTEKDGDDNNIGCVYLKNIENGIATLRAPSQLGKFDIRVFDGDNESTAKEIAYLPIVIKYAPDLKVSIDVASKFVQSGAPLDINVDISGFVPSDAWITFVPSDVPHTEKDGDDNNIGCVYLNNIENGIATLTAPSQLGKFDIRVYNGDNEYTASEIACMTVYLAKAPGLSVVLSVDNAQVKPDEDMTIYTDISGDIPNDAWITFVPSDIPHTEKDGDDHNGKWMYLKDIECGKAVLKTPAEVGKYDIRVYDGSNGLASEIACLPILITETPAAATGSSMGDLNSDGVFNVADVVLLQKWLLADSDTYLPSWKNGDFIADGKLDIFDLCRMRRALVASA